jgi:hypothetical protein
MQSMSVQQLLQSPKVQGTKGEVVDVANGKQQKLGIIEGLLSKGKKIVEGQDSEVGELDFSSLISEAQSTESENPKVEKQLTGKIAKTSNSLSQLLNSLKGTEDQSSTPENSAGKVQEGVLKTPTKDFFPRQQNESVSPLEFLVKNVKEKNITTSETPNVENILLPQQEKVGGEKSELQVQLQAAFQKNLPIQNKLIVPESAEKMQTKDQAVKLVSGEEFVKNLKTSGPHLKEDKFEKKQLSILENKIPQVKSYGKGQNILNDSVIRNTNDLAFKDVKKLKTSATDELKSPDLKVANELSMIKESPLASLQLKTSPVQENKVQVETKVLNLSNIDAKNTNEIIKSITDYVEQNQVANRSSLDLTVKHDSLGQFKIQVNKSPTQNQVDMQITTSSTEGHKFFVAHEADLMRNLQQAGVNLTDLRIISSMKESTPFSQSESKQFSSFQHEQNGDSKQFMSFESGDFKEGSQKRKSLWDEYQERYGA